MRRKGSSPPARPSAARSLGNPKATRSRSPPPAALATSRSSSSPPFTTRRELFPAPENRRSPERQRHGRRLSRGRTSRAARSRGEDRPHERPRRGGGRRDVRRDRCRAAHVGGGWYLAPAAPAV